MRLKTLLAVLAALALSTTFAAADIPRSAAQKCAEQTRAPGNYYLSDAPGLPHVLPSPDGTVDGAARINDCLKDAYAVQYGARLGEVSQGALAETGGVDAAQKCRQTRNGQVVVGTVLTAGIIAAIGEPYTAATIGGLIGLSQGVKYSNQEYAKCVNAAAPPVNPNAAIYTGCSRRNGVMSGGTRLCVAP
ncbi:MAG: hypothetical protein ABJX32_15070 [Tateyamaria sp.]|jgi:hypothetical protein|uniref:hypothetical protein n=1 Tax=unclassified Tateyamaria TaxID=2645127 RepID=UPI000D5579DE|nr:hypothetical protein [Tateyamaria sp. Alg231-49]